MTKNKILYGSSGTGKTYNTVVEAMRIIAPEEINYAGDNVTNYPYLKEKFDEYKKQGRIEFITFHQSYSYENFVEGIKPVIPDSEEWGNKPVELKYTGKDGIFKKFCQRANANSDKKYVFIIDDINRGRLKCA